MKSSVVCVALTFVMLTVATPALAQIDSSEETSAQARVEITPYVSFGSVTSSRIGGAIRWPWTSDLSVELEVGYRRGEMNALSSNVSLLYDLPRVGRLAPYLASGVGLDQYGTALEVPGGGIATQPRTAFTVNAGGGVRVPVDENWGVRTDARWFNGIGKHAPERWRLYNGVTLGRAR